MRPSIVNVWLIDGGSEWALVDTGMHTEASMSALRGVMTSLGVEPAAVRHIICTHHHPDHFGTSGPLRDLCQGKVLLHPLEAERVGFFLPRARSAEAAAFFRGHGIPLDRFMDVPTPGQFWAGLYVPATPDLPLDDDDEIRVGHRTVRVVWTPGHAPGHCCLHVPDVKALIVGDHLLPKISPHVGVYPDGPENPLGDYLASLDKVARLDVDLILPAHGGVYRDHRHRVAQLRQHHEYRLLAGLDAVRARPKTAYEVAREMFDFDADAPPQVQFPATFEALAHLELLISRGKIARQDDGDRIRFRAS